MTAPHKPAGIHLIADFHGADAAILADAAAIEEMLVSAAREAGAQVLFSHFHAFGEGGGITGVVLLAESHISIHTWPEEGFAAADIFMCGSAQPVRALRRLQETMKARHFELQSVERGERV